MSQKSVRIFKKVFQISVPKRSNKKVSQKVPNSVKKRVPKSVKMCFFVPTDKITGSYFLTD